MTGKLPVMRANDVTCKVDSELHDKQERERVGMSTSHEQLLQKLDDVDFAQVESLRKIGLEDGERISVLQESCEQVPSKKGVYLVVRQNNQPVRFSIISSGGHTKGDPSVEVAILEQRWFHEPMVLYIGKAGGTDQKSNLQKRIRAYVQFGLGKSRPHWGGRYIWQLADAKELAIYWLETPGIEPREAEKKLLRLFKERWGKLPFANLKS